MSSSARRTGPALEAHHRFLLWLIPTLEKFPRAQRFLLGDRIETAALDVLERLIEATDSRVQIAPQSHPCISTCNNPQMPTHLRPEL